ncbi:MAG TPA: PEGA domain-containing protein [Blastocatellia bacterium]|nr:PEGA domain-containing protein [Blastocatellia bacterium]
MGTEANVTTSAEYQRPVKRHLGARWWPFAAAAAVLITTLTVAGVYLITKKPSTVDYLVISTVPSGAEIKLDAQDYGQTPVKLEQVKIGTYTLTITKEGYEPVVEQITVSESIPELDYKLKLLPPSDAIGKTPEEVIHNYQERAEDAFADGRYGFPLDDSALFYSGYILSLDPNNQFALDMKERVRKALLQSAQSAIARKDSGLAQEIYNLLLEQYPKDPEIQAAAAKLESQLSSRKGEVLDLVRKAEEALRAGHLIEPALSSAYYYSKQALAIDRQNAQARAVRVRVKESLAAAAEQAYARGDADSAIRQFEHVTELFSEDKQLRARLREIESTRAVETAKANDPTRRRLQGLDNYRKGNFDEAIPDLQFAVSNGAGTPDVMFALARSHMKLGQFDEAADYFNRVPPNVGDAYRSSIAALGEIAMERGDTAKALERYKEARRLGGSPLYSVSTLDDRIEKIERRQREKAAEPKAASVQVKHLHGSLRGSCSGTLTVDRTGVRYDGSEHTYSANFIGVGVQVGKDEMSVSFQSKSQKFKVDRSEAERFREALTRYQQANSSTNR